MERIKKINELKMYQGSVLIKIHLKESLIVSPTEDNTLKPLVNYAEVIAKTEDIKDLEVGDIILDFRTTEGFTWKDDKYSVVPRMNIKLAVSRSNFKLGTKIDKNEPGN